MERLIAGGLFGWALGLMGLVAFFGLVWVRRREQREYLVFAGFCASSAVHCAGNGLAHLAHAELSAGRLRLASDLMVGSAVVISG